MRWNIPGALSIATVFSLTSALWAQDVTFELIHPNAAGANDMSPDGRYIVGDADFDGDGFGDGSYLLDTDTGIMTDLENSVDPTLGVPVVAVSDDGTVVLGNIPDPEGIGSQVAAIWRAATGEWESLGYLPNAGACPSRSSAYELSADGSVAVGLSWDGCSGRGFYWTEATGMVELEPLANGGNRASVVSADGTLIGGFAQGSFERTPAIWDSTTDGELLDPPNGDALGEIHGMSDDGTILLGEWWSEGTPGTTTRATKWTWNGSGWDRETIGAGSLLPGWSGNAMDIADDGTIVGFDFLLGNRRAWIQPQGTGPLIELRSYIESHGGVVPAGLPLHVCQAISADGKYVIGHGFATGAWRLTIKYPLAGDLDGDGDVDLEDFSTFSLCFSGPGNPPAPSCPPGVDADLDDDGDVDLGDFSTFASNFTGTQ